MDILCMDFHGAFDKVPPDRLVKKVKSHGMEGELAEWIHHWLGDRR